MAALATSSAVFAKKATRASVARRAVRGTPAPKRVSARAEGMKAEYIWLDSQEGEKAMGFNEMRAKTKCLDEIIPVGGEFPDWSFDGSSTGQAEGNNSDCILKVVESFPDPIRGAPHVLCLCEIYDPESNPHPTNSRAPLREKLTDAVLAENPLFGMEQEYTMLTTTGRVFGWGEQGYPAPQGPFYCGVGANAVYGRPLAEAHMDACMKAGLKISGINAEVMPGQWEFQIGPAGPLEVGDHIHIGRYLLHRLGEDYGVAITFDAKPVKGDWNGTGMHTNYSTKSTMKDGGMATIDTYIERLSKKHPEHIANYGLGNEQRLTGAHETCDIDTFRSGVADRGASIRIPLPVQLAAEEGKGGYMEDRRPSANADPYKVAMMLISTTLEV